MTGKESCAASYFYAATRDIPKGLGTPVLDLKPYLSSVLAENLRRGWLAEAEARRNS